MASTIERIGIVETKVSNLDEKLDDLKVDVKDVHDCLDRTRDEISNQLKTIHESSTKQHAELSEKIHEIEHNDISIIINFFKIIGSLFILSLSKSRIVVSNLSLILDSEGGHEYESQRKSNSGTMRKSNCFFPIDLFNC